MYIGSKALYNIFWLAVAIMFLHMAALKFYFYWAYPWYDIPMHLLGGILIARIALWIVHYFKHLQNKEFEFKSIFRISLWSVLTIGILWEVFELKVGITTNTLPDTIDSVKDVLNDVIGALLLSWYFVSKYKK